ncbi:metallophosphoesterase family protein [Hymenobacter sp. H14-R3]|uniref:metallophosphoesterase family protein n=1 Tax=Hymenobacter sp. H14-R3 TaxID=3046308 RepID=UPI0024B8CB15|nr:metallophosphoesterase family protein [Hymenobacter sp. H14-R3]MDJ0365424.1 metallophosphoesterase family protein [Hymenobacter sp. H14-R3]
MTRIALLSDTHSYFDARIAHHLRGADEIWHAGDFGSSELVLRLAALAPVFRGVYGNIDGTDIRCTEPLVQTFSVEGLPVLMTHIGGYPGHYAPAARQLLAQARPGLFVCGHSHILRVMPDSKLGLLALNPGAAGRHGFHKVRTLLRFGIDKGKVVEMQAVELGPRTALLDVPAG